MSDMYKYEDDDPYVAEVRRIRDKINKEANYDPVLIAKRAAEFARKIGMRLSSLQPLAPRFAS